MAYRDPRYFELLETFSKPIAPLTAGADIATNDVLVAASRRDSWLRAASTSQEANFVPGLVRVGAVITFDLLLCNGAGKPVPNAILKIITAGAVTLAGAAAATTVAAATTSAPAANAGVLHEQPIVGVLVAAGAALGNQTGRITTLQANNVGRLTGTLTMNVDQNQALIIEYLHKRTTAVVVVQPA